jgi:hypothetical protein
MAQETPILHPTIRHLLDEPAIHAGPAIYELTPEEARATLLRAQSGSVRKPDAQTRDWNVNSEKGVLRLGTIRPHGAGDYSPAILYFHGGVGS